MNQARNIGKLIGAKGGGCALVVDYGANKSFNDSLRVCIYQTWTSNVLTSSHIVRPLKDIKLLISSAALESVTLRPMSILRC